MAEDVEFRRLSVDNTLKSGLSILGVAFLIVLFVGSLIAIGFFLQEKEVSETFSCDNSNTIDAEYVEDGDDDCGDGSDEVNGARDDLETWKLGFFSYTMFGCSAVFLIAGILGMSTKVIADSISAGLALHQSETPEKTIVQKNTQPTQAAYQPQQQMRTHVPAQVVQQPTQLPPPAQVVQQPTQLPPPEPPRVQ